MRAMLAFLLALAVCWPLSAAGLTVVEAVVTTAIVDREPVDVVQTYPATVDRLYCFTELAGASGETTVTHVWYFGDEVTSRSVLPVRGASWRTWSAKVMRPEWAGKWRVEVLDADGKLLTTIPFTLTGR